jgi:hypothetical protein
VVDIPSDETAQDSPAVKVGVLLDLKPGNIGEWLADAAAFDLGGVDGLWIDSGSEPELDVLALTAALAAVTYRTRLVVALPPNYGTAAAGLARTLDTIGQLSHGRLVVVADSRDSAELAVLAPGIGIFRRASGEPGSFEDIGAGADGERWVSMPAPEGRAAWRAACADAAGRGARGVLVPADPRLLDILRNPDDPGERHDLQLAQG